MENNITEEKTLPRFMPGDLFTTGDYFLLFTPNFDMMREMNKKNKTFSQPGLYIGVPQRFIDQNNIWTGYAKKHKTKIDVIHPGSALFIVEPEYRKVFSIVIWLNRVGYVRIDDWMRFGEE